MLAPWKESYDKPRQHIEKQRLHFADKSPYSQNYSHARMWELVHKQGTEELILSNWGAREDSWDSKEIKPVNPKGNKSWIFIGRTDAEAEAPSILTT